MIKHHRSDVIGKFILHHMDNGHRKCAFPDLSTRRDRMKIKYLVDEAVKPVRGGEEFGNDIGIAAAAATAVGRDFE